MEKKMNLIVYYWLKGIREGLLNGTSIRTKRWDPTHRYVMVKEFSWDSSTKQIDVCSYTADDMTQDDGLDDIYTYSTQGIDETIKFIEGFFDMDEACVRKGRVLQRKNDDPDADWESYRSA